MNCIKELYIVPNIVNPSSVSIQLSGKKQFINTGSKTYAIHLQKLMWNYWKGNHKILAFKFFNSKFKLKSGHHQILQT